RESSSAAMAGRSRQPAAPPRDAPTSRPTIPPRVAAPVTSAAVRLPRHRRCSRPQRSAPPVRRQPLLCAGPLRRLPVDCQSRFSILDHLRPTSRGRHLSPLLAARSDAGGRALREGTARPAPRGPSVAHPRTAGRPAQPPPRTTLAAGIRRVSAHRPGKGSIMTLAEKLERLRLPTMSRQLDQSLQHAAEKNLSPAAALEWLADLELEARNGRAVQRRFHFSRL